MFNAEVAQGIDTDDFGNFIDGVMVSNQIFRRVNIRAIVARRNKRRSADAHVNFFCAGFAQKLNGSAAGGPTYDGVVNQNHALSGDDAANRIELDVNTDLALFLCRGDKGSPNVFVFGKTNAVWNTGGVGIAQGGFQAGIGNANNDIGINRMFSG